MRKRHAQQCWRSNDKLIGDLPPIDSYILCSNVSWPADAGCSQEDWLREMANRDRWWNRVKRHCAINTNWWWYLHASGVGAEIVTKCVGEKNVWINVLQGRKTLQSFHMKDKIVMRGRENGDIGVKEEAFVKLVGWILWHIDPRKLFKAKSIFKQIKSFISNNSVQHKYTVYLWNTFLFQAIQFIQIVLIQLILFSISTDCLHTVKCQKQFHFKQFSLV